MSSLNVYFGSINDALHNYDGTELSNHISCRHSHVGMSKLLALSDISGTCSRYLPSPWDELFGQHIKCIQYLSNYDFIKAFGEQQALIQVLVRILQQQKDENWCLPVMYTACLDIRLMGSQADKQAQQRKMRHKPGELLEKSAESVMSCFRVCVSDTRAAPQDTKRIGMMHVVNQLFKIYYNLNTLQLCKPLIRAVDASPFKDSFAVPQMVTYKFYVGRKAMFDNDIRTAQEYLSYAFQHCHQDCLKNKRLILIYLIPVKMLLGYQPKYELLKKYDLLQFVKVCEAVRKGNAQKFAEELDANEPFFIRYGVYLILEKLRTILYRNLFKRVYHILGTHMIPIQAFVDILKFMKIDDIDLDETQCILANLIYQGKIKGYVSLQHSKLVVSKQNAFPKLSSLQ